MSKSSTDQKRQERDAETLSRQLVLTGADIVSIGEDAELIVGGKNYNTALISRIDGVRTPQFRAISSLAFHMLLDQCRVNAALVRGMVEKAYADVDWPSQAVTGDHEFLPHFVRRLARDIQEVPESGEGRIRLRAFINHVVDGFATSQEDIDQLRKRSILVQAAILSVNLPEAVDKAVRAAYQAICAEAEESNVPVAVRSSAAGEDSRKKAFAGLQDTYLNMVGDDNVVRAYQWDCASAYNLRSMIYRREAIRDAMILAERTGEEDLTQAARKEWTVENTSLSVCLMRMVNPVVSGTAFSADTATGCRGTLRNDLVSIDTSYGLGEAVVGGIVTPDKLYVYQKDDGTEVVLRFMGHKNKKIVYDESGGTRQVDVPAREALQWALSVTHAEHIAKGVRAVSRAYDGMIMDTEFCIDSKGVLWFVQARPETRWNEEFELHPHTIFMRRKEVDAAALIHAEVVLEGNGASRGAGQGLVKFLRSALELNKVNKGEVLAAERTDPDMVPGMRVASAILADVGGDTSHAAITSRELGIPAIIGIQQAEALKALDGQHVTVDGTRGKVYRGLLPLVDVGGEMDLSKLPATKTNVGLVLADVGQSMFLSRLRTMPDFEVGLLRAEFMLGNIGIHPQALEAFDNGELDKIVKIRLSELESQLRKVVREQLAQGLVTLDLRLREYVGQVSGYAAELTKLGARSDMKSPDEFLAVYRRMREVERLLDDRVEQASRRMDVLEASDNLAEHVRAIMGESMDSDDVQATVDSLMHDTVVQDMLRQIREIREDVSARCGLKKSIDDLRAVPGKIGELVRARGYKTGRDYFIQMLSQNLALFAMAFYGRPIVYRTTDFKTNEYYNLLGGNLYEHIEDNPMLGYRGVSRNLHDWELEAFKQARGAYGGRNLQLMLPFVRTLEQARSMRAYLGEVHALRSGEDDLKIIMMSELPSNAILAREFIQEFDGFSIGSNDMTQMVLATDRDNASLSHIYDEEDPAVIWALLTTIFTGQKYGKKVGFCGQGFANSPIVRGVCSIAGIVSASVVPDTYYQAKLDVAAIEKEGIPASGLGGWIAARHMDKLRTLLKAKGQDKALKACSTPTECRVWYENETRRHLQALQESLGSAREAAARQTVETFRATFHKPVIYASWNWDEVVFDALRQSGFASFEEQVHALEAQRKVMH